MVAKGAKGKEPSPQDFINDLLGAPIEFTGEQAARLAGLDPEWTLTLWRALGFPHPGNEPYFTTKDVAALKDVSRLIDRGHLTPDQAIEVSRSFGQGTARMAEWVNNIMGRVFAERGVLPENGMLVPGELGPLIQESMKIQPAFHRLLVYTWRRQSVATVERAIALMEVNDEPTDVMSVGFADLVGFTRLSREIDDADLAQLVVDFEASATDVVTANGSRLIKTIGDEVLFVNESAHDLAETALALLAMSEQKEDLPQLRIGLATGSVVTRMGDVFGTTVNRASRLTAIAKPNSLLCDGETAEALESDEAFEVKSVRPRPIRGFGLMRSWTLSHAKVEKDSDKEKKKDKDKKDKGKDKEDKQSK